MSTVTIRDPGVEILGWLVWYDNGLTFDSRVTTWAELPNDGLLLKMIYYVEGGRRLQQGYSFYFEAPHPSGYIVRGESESSDAISDRYPGAVIKNGIWVPDEVYYVRVEQAMASTWEV